MRNLIIVVFILLAILCIKTECYGDVPGANTIKGIISTEWIKTETLRYGTAITYGLNGVFDGLIESGKFNGKHIINSDNDNYHVIKWMENITSYGSGYLTYGIIKNKQLSWWNKFSILSSSVLIRRNTFEWMYRWNRLGDPFNYSDVSSNRKALVYFKWSPQKGFCDMYISGVGAQGVLIDLICVGLSMWLIK